MPTIDLDAREREADRGRELDPSQLNGFPPLDIEILKLRDAIPLVKEYAGPGAERELKTMAMRLQWLIRERRNLVIEQPEGESGPKLRRVKDQLHSWNGFTGQWVPYEGGG